MFSSECAPSKGIPQRESPIKTDDGVRWRHTVTQPSTFPYQCRRPHTPSLQFISQNPHIPVVSASSRGSHYTILYHKVGGVGGRLGCSRRRWQHLLPLPVTQSTCCCPSPDQYPPHAILFIRVTDSHASHGAKLANVSHE
ncbi:hypothetical protein CDAR_375531 [Caerostris darwini]|uniref:Uncharacterized protein n=1 Tax=Caerostris darwini TaxID=1538125 RepID=A0AAV4S698_9ARAC|nr:hypothetical protein CDAR_375531 [Caerostris darwini]